MKWFEGSIVDAVATSKKRSAFFVVFIEGKDDLSRVMSTALEQPDISEQLGSNKFVSIKLDSQSESYKQFSEIYKLVPIPSVFFIGQTGSPLDIVAGESAETGVLNKLRAAIHKCEPSKQEVVAPAAKNESVSNSSSSTTVPGTSQMTGSKSEPISVKTETNSPATSEPVLQPSVVHPSQSEGSISLNTDVPPTVCPPPTACPPPTLQGMSQASGNQPEAESPPTASDVAEEQSTSNEIDLSLEEKVDRAKQLLEQKKELKKAQEEQDEKEKELERRKVGQAMMEVKRKQQERELLELKEERKREKMEEKAAKQRILDQIAQDRVDRAARSAVHQNVGEVSSSPPQAVEPQERPSPSVDTNTARLQFKMPDGQTRTHTFPAETTLGQVRQFIDNNIVLPFREYQMATTFPRREFTFRDINSDLRSLELLPSAVILIMPLQGVLQVSRGSGWSQAMVDMVWSLVQPLLTFSRYLKSLIWSGGGEASGSGSDSQRTREATPSHQNPRHPSSSTSRTVRKRGNIHSLGDADSSNDENNTWNGNSTQQM